MADWDAIKTLAPRVPEETCPIIDQISTLLSAIDGDLGVQADSLRTVKNKDQAREMASEMLDHQANLASARLRLEELRKENEALRASGRYWYGVAKNLAEVRAS